MARVAEWKEKVAACRSSGQTVRGWYEEQGINRKRYYYWERTVLAEAEKQLSEEESSGRAKFVSVPALPEQRIPERGGTALAAKVRLPGVPGVRIHGSASWNRRSGGFGAVAVSSESVPKGAVSILRTAKGPNQRIVLGRGWFSGGVQTVGGGAFPVAEGR